MACIIAENVENAAEKLQKRRRKLAESAQKTQNVAPQRSSMEVCALVVTTGPNNHRVREPQKTLPDAAENAENVAENTENTAENAENSAENAENPQKVQKTLRKCRKRSEQCRIR